MVNALRITWPTDIFGLKSGGVFIPLQILFSLSKFVWNISNAHRICIESTVARKIMHDFIDVKFSFIFSSKMVS